jgi:amidase
MSFPIDDTVGAWLPHGRFVIDGRAGGTLSGLRFGAKDLFDIAGHVTGAGNPDWLASHTAATRHSAVVARLLEAAAAIMGKVQTDLLAYSLHGNNAHYGAPITPRAPLRVTGGSSSGSAAVVATGLVEFALGTDTGGSTRVPASYCGLRGLRTSHSLLSAAGLVQLYPRFDTVTWQARDAVTFERVARVLLPVSRFTPSRVLSLDDAWALADEEFAEPMARALHTLATQVGAPPEACQVAGGEALSAWRQV